MESQCFFAALINGAHSILSCRRSRDFYSTRRPGYTSPTRATPNSVGLLSILILLSFNAGLAGAGTEDVTQAAKTFPRLAVVYDQASNLLSIHAHEIPLDKILQEIYTKSHLTVDSANEELLNEEISIEVRGLPLEQAAFKLFEGYNAAFFFSSPADTKTGTTRLLKVRLLSKKPSAHMEDHANEENVPAGSRPAIGSTVSGNEFDELLLAVNRHNLLRAKEAASALKESGKEDAREAAVNSLIENLKAKDFQSYESTMAALKELAPGAAVSILANWLTEDDRQLQVSAASGLGQLGDKSGIEILISALNSADPSIRQAAASSLARIGGERATNFLIQTYLAGDDSTKNAVAVAVLSHGNENLQKTLMNSSTGLQRPGNFLTPSPTAPPVRYNQSRQ